MSLHITVTWFVMGGFLVLLVAPLYFLIYLFRWTTRERKSPLNVRLLRSPGQSLREAITDLTGEIFGQILMIPFLALWVYASCVTYFILTDNPSMGVMYIAMAFVIVISVYLLHNTYKLFQRRNRLRLAHECEVVVGQYLHNLLPHGFKIYHDFPADRFNIDHIAIGPTGIFAIETKGRAKQIKAENENWKLTFDGESLRFPGWTEKQPVQQARRQVAAGALKFSGYKKPLLYYNVLHVIQYLPIGGPDEFDCSITGRN
jgi:hypothetical protein